MTQESKSPTVDALDGGLRLLVYREGADEVEGEVEGVATSTLLLERLLWPLSERGGAEQLAVGLLEFALDQTRRQIGLLGVFDPMGRLSVLASCNRKDVGKDVGVPESLLCEARTALGPYIRSTGIGNTVSERLVVPFGPDPRGLLILEGGLPDSSTGQACLRLAKALGQIISSRFTEVCAQEQLREEVHRLRFHRAPAHATILASARLHSLRRNLEAAGTHDRPVLLVGEEGTESQDLARYLHAQGSRNTGPFVAFHSPGFPPHRLDEGLFGGGSPAGPAARQGRPTGALPRARGGTLYIEGPDLLPTPVQTRLFQALTEGARHPHGNVTCPQVRIVASVTQPPKEGSGLSEELTKLLGGIQIQIPPLRGHAEDIGALAELILSEMGPGPDGRPRVLTEGAKRRLLSYQWPGNLREMRTVLEAAAARSGPQPIAGHHLPKDVQEPTEADEAGLATLEEVEIQHIGRVLDAVGGSRARAAKVLGIANSTLYEKIKRSGPRG